jgi:two-component system, chemotaxis family, protein-glutamate methylesterase/glutaminase
MAKKIRVMVVEDSQVVRQFLEHIISSDPRLEVVASVGSAEDALLRLRSARPDVISMDIHLPGMNGFEATKKIMEEHPTPIVVVSGSMRREDQDFSIEALKAGALGVLMKPVGTSHEDYESLATRLCTQLAIMSQVRVIRQRFNGRRSRKKAERTAPISASGLSPVPPNFEPPGPFSIVAIVASTGGPSALQVLLAALPKDFPLPILLVQHITAGFFGSFVSWLDDVCPLPVRAALHEQVLQPGCVHIAPPDHHLCASGGRLMLSQKAPVCAQRPSGTVLFQSLADSYGPEALGILLTGMGVDGADGLRAIRQAGGYTLAEDSSTAVVYGMPAAAVQLGAVCESLPLDSIAGRMLRLVRPGETGNPGAPRPALTTPRPRAVPGTDTGQRLQSP